MIFAFVIDCVPLILRKVAFDTDLVESVFVGDLLANFLDESIEGVVLSISNHASIFIEAIGASLIWSVIALWLCCRFGRSELGKLRLRFRYFVLFGFGCLRQIGKATNATCLDNRFWFF